MLRSAGYFLGVPCPAEESGCQRPYCPFRHKSKRVDDIPNISRVTDIDNTIEKIKNELRGLTASANVDSDGNAWSPIQNETYEPSLYNHEEEGSHHSDPKSILPFARGPTCAKKSRKSRNIYQHHPANHPSTDLEYDPVVNYSTFGHTRSKINEDRLSGPSTSRADTSLTERDVASLLEDSDDDRYFIDENDEAVGEIFGGESEEKRHNTGIIVVSSGESDENNVVDLTKERKDQRKTVKKRGKLKSEKENSIKATKGNLKTLENEKERSNPKDSFSLSKKRDTKKRKHSHDEKPKKVRKIDPKNHAKLKISSTSKKLKTVTAKDIDTKTISKYVDRDEIKQLEQDLATADRYQECLRIFKEDEVTRGHKKQKETASSESVPAASEVFAPSTQVKRRIAHIDAATSAQSLGRPITTKKKRIRSTPAQIMMNRLDVIEQEEAQRILTGQSTKRVAHGMGSGMAAFRAKDLENRLNVKKFQDSHVSNPHKTDFGTICGTINKGTSRIAHESKDLLAIKNGSDIPPRPRIEVARFSKIPANIRQRYLTCFIDECLRIHKNNHEDAYSMAVAEEEECRKRSNIKSTYMSLAASTLKKLRERKGLDSSSSKRMVKPVNQKAHRSNSTKKTMSHDSLLLTNTKKCKGGYTIQKKEERPSLSASDLYEKMCCYIMTPEQLDKNGYPRPSDVPGKAEFKTDDAKKTFNTADKKICVRCGKEFYLNRKGKFSKVEECTYHWGRAYMTKVGRGWEKRYSCCQEQQGVEGCAICDTHVHADNKLDRSRYVRTLSKSPPPDGNFGIFTLDCEMCYTTAGLELTRVSVLDTNCKPVYETFVRPSGRVLDYNTRWSGITEEDLINVKTSLRDVQAAFLCKFSSETILMGHSLESDLVALRIIHETVVDTSIVFPHKRGFPYKRALKNITSENLGLVIQSGAVEGHDSAEDAAACMKLMLWRIDEDSKVSIKK